MKIIKETYSAKAAEYIRELIRSGSLRPGQPIRECVISEDLGISRAPIREALLLLSEQGIICSEPHKGKYVRRMTPAEVYDSYVVAGILEGAGVAASVSRWGKKEHEAFGHVIRHVEQINEETDQDMLADIDEEFHRMLLSACTNNHLVHLARTSCSTIAKFLYYNDWISLFTPLEYRSRHIEIIDVVRSAERTRIECTLREHYEETGRLLSARICD